VPLYEYQCAKCGRFELIKKFSDPAVTTCPTCGRDITKLPSAPAFHLKGTGWYVTDYAKKSGGSDGAASSSNGSSSKEDSSSKDVSSKDSSSKESSSSSKESSSKDSSSKDSPSSTASKDSATSGSSSSK
jgi:putative FmdB family regulatory protein